MKLKTKFLEPCLTQSKCSIMLVIFTIRIIFSLIFPSLRLILNCYPFFIFNLFFAALSLYCCFGLLYLLQAGASLWLLLTGFGAQT